jgi:predicted RNA-binding Zn ribbon-like protein
MDYDGNIEIVRREPAPGQLRAVADLCNTANRIRALDTLGELRSAQTWANRNGVARRLRAVDVEAIVAAREIIRAFLVDRSDGAARTGLNSLAATTFRAPAIGTDGQLTFVQNTQDPVAALVAPALTALLRDGLSGEGKRLKACAAPGCRWIFFDRSHASNGRWCDMDVCGARHKMRHYRVRKASVEPAAVTDRSPARP